MDKIQAKEKINKLLRLANDKGATPSERDTALEMATKLATKYGFRIQKGTPSTSNQNNQVTKIRYEFDLNCYNKKFVIFLFDLLGIPEFRVMGKKTVYFYDYRNFNVDAFKKFYKKFVSVYYKTKKVANVSEKEFFEKFSYFFTSGVLDNCVFEFKYFEANNLGFEFKNTKFFM